MSANAISVQGLSKMYRIGAPRHYQTLRESVTSSFSRFGKRGEKYREFWALQDLSFDIKHGEVVGIIGRNGAGKSTLLKILSRITRPTRGHGAINGRVASLLEVGTGFHPELSGRENIFLNGAVLGMSRAELASRFDEIVAFAEVEKFLDTPVKRYSSGMYVRLAFAIAAHLEPEILIIDEVLAVGDLAFQKKCLGKMSEVSRGGRTVLFVSHNMASVENLCQRGIVLNQGKLVFDGDLRAAVDHYLHGMPVPEGQVGHVTYFDQAKKRSAPEGKLLQSIELYTDGGAPVIEGIRLGASLRLKVNFNLPRAVENVDIGLGFDDLFGSRMFTAHSTFEPSRASGQRLGPRSFTCEIPSFTLMPGAYNIRVWLDFNHSRADVVADAAQFTVLDGDYYGTGKAAWSGKVVMPQQWWVEEANDQTGEQLAPEDLVNER